MCVSVCIKTAYMEHAEVWDNEQADILASGVLIVAALMINKEENLWTPTGLRYNNRQNNMDKEVWVWNEVWFKQEEKILTGLWRV